MSSSRIPAAHGATPPPARAPKQLPSAQLLVALALASLLPTGTSSLSWRASSAVAEKVDAMALDIKGLKDEHAAERLKELEDRTRDLERRVDVIAERGRKKE